MKNIEIVVDIIAGITGVILLSDVVFNFLPDRWVILLLILDGIALSYFFIKAAAKETVKEVLGEKNNL